MRKKKSSGSYIDYETSGSYEGSAGSSGLIKVETDPVKRSKLWLYILIALAVIFAGLFVYQKLYDAKRTKDSFAAAKKPIWSPFSQNITLKSLDMLRFAICIR